MDCNQVGREELVERYLRAELSEPEMEAFEQHYFECPHCLDMLQTLRAAQEELARNRPTLEAVAHRPGLLRPLAWVGTAGVAVAIVLGVWLYDRLAPGEPFRPAVTQSVPGEPPPKGRDLLLAELARVEPPHYTPVTLRGATDDATQRFREAMKHYQAGHYVTAISGLRKAVELNPKAAEAHFFLSTCYLLTGETDSAIAGLRRTVALGDSAYLEETHFFLAKAFLRKGDLTAAKTELRKMVQLRGDLESEGKELLKKIEELEQGSR